MFPEHFASIYGYYGLGTAQKMKIISKMLHISEIFAELHSCLNPLVYGTGLRHFRFAYMMYINSLFSCRWSSRLAQEHAQISHSSELYGDSNALSKLAKYCITCTESVSLAKFTCSRCWKTDVVLSPCTEEQNMADNFLPLKD